MHPQNIKFGKPNYDLLGQVTYNTSDGADWTKGTIMLDFPTFRPSIGDHLRFNEPFCKCALPLGGPNALERRGGKDKEERRKTREENEGGKEKKGRSQLTGPSLDANLSTTLINEFPCRPHWTKNTRDIFTQALKNLDQDVSLKSATKHATPFHLPPPGYFHFSRHPCCIHSNVFSYESNQKLVEKKKKKSVRLFRN